MPASWTRVVVAILALVLIAAVRPAPRVPPSGGLACEARALSASDAIASAEVARSEWVSNREHVRVARATTALNRLRARQEADHWSTASRPFCATVT